MSNNAKLNNYKIEVQSPEQSEAVQKAAFEMGYSLKHGGKDLKNTEAPYLYFYGDGDITHDWDPTHFMRHSNQEVSPEDFLKLLITYPNEPLKHCDLICEWAKGAIIQYWTNLRGGAWVDTAENRPAWCPEILYRVKPQNPNADRIEEIEKELREMAEKQSKLADELKSLK